MKKERGKRKNTSDPSTNEFENFISIKLLKVLYKNYKRVKMIL